MKYDEEKNYAARRLLMETGALYDFTLHDGSITGQRNIMCYNNGIVTHFTIQGDFKQLQHIRFGDYSNVIRINSTPTKLPRRFGKLLLPVANVEFTHKYFDDIRIIDTRGAMFAHVVNAIAFIELTGNCKRVIVRQHGYANPPRDSVGNWILPVLDLQAVNMIG